MKQAAAFPETSKGLIEFLGPTGGEYVESSLYAFKDEWKRGLPQSMNLNLRHQCAVCASTFNLQQCCARNWCPRHYDIHNR